MAPRKNEKSLVASKMTNVSKKTADMKKLQKLQKYADNKAYLDEYSPEVLIEALNIEAAFSLANQFKQSKVLIKKLGNHEYVFVYEYENTPLPDVHGLTVCLRSKANVIIRGRAYHYQPRTSQLYFKCGISIDITERYYISYESNRYLIDLCIDAVQSIKNLQLLEYFSTFEQQIKFSKKRNIKGPKKWYNGKIGEDLMQQEAVKMLLNESAYPYPFVITGGPGTGKTSVIVETVVQIIHNKSWANILITCQSNAACDEVAIRLLKYLPPIKVFRYYSYKYYLDFKDKQENYSKDSYFAKLCRNSTMQPKNKSCTVVDYVNPTRQSLATFKIIVATMTASVSLIKNDIKNDHFDFIFVDECSAAIEPECLIPIISLGMEKSQVNANIVLVGDDKLLGPILSSPLAKGLGLEQSLIERIMRMKLYDPERSESKGRVVWFTNNYRSHPEIYKYSNEIFYNSSMESMVPTQDYKLAMKWKQLPNPDIPIIFHSTKTESLGNHDGFSWNNADEVDLVFDYVQNLLSVGLPENTKITQDQIGIASPYRAQVKLLREKLREHPEIDIGTTEFFQGREKPIMIISAAKSRNLENTQDFLDNPRRLNVLLTRAKSLMIIIGNLEKLKLIASWERFIEHCIKSGLARRGPLNDDVDEDGHVLMERFSLLRIEDDLTSSASDDESIVLRLNSEEISLDSDSDEPLQEGVPWNDAM